MYRLEVNNVKIGLDIDGVISDFVTTFCRLTKKKYNICLTESDIYCHDLNLVLGITKNERNEIIKETLKENLNLTDGSKETINKLWEDGHKIYLLTARDASLIETTKLWLKNNDIPYTKLLQLKEGEKNHSNLKLDLIVEDCLQDALEWSPKVKNILVFDHPWNKSLNVKGLIKRVHSWKEIYQEIQRLE
jgi:uncharacterized HAD superfamily protein